MFAIAYMLAGLFSLAAGTGILGTWLRKHPSRENAERTSRIMHFLFFAGLIAPSVVGFFRPGLAHFDERVGLRPLPAKRFFFVLGVILAVPGFYLLAVSNRLLRALGSGANAFRLTKHLVLDNVYRFTRNPMSLGSYFLWVSTGLVGGSSFLTLLALLGLVPAHIFFLKYFEELELELRFGESYLDYKRKVPFLFPKFVMPGKPDEEAAGW